MVLNFTQFIKIMPNKKNKKVAPKVVAKAKTNKKLAKPVKKVVAKKTAVKKIVAKKTPPKKVVAKKIVKKAVAPKKSNLKKAKFIAKKVEKKIIKKPLKLDKKKSAKKEVKAAKIKKEKPVKKSEKKAETKKTAPIKKEVAIKKEAPAKVESLANRILAKNVRKEEVKIEKPLAKPAPAKVETKSKISFKVGQYAVYPSHGVGKIIDIESTEVLGQEFKCYLMNFEKERLSIKIPVNNADKIGLRHLVSKKEMDEVFVVLRSGVKKLKGMWSRRAQEYETKINSGDIMLLAEVLRDLTRDIEDSERSYSERIIYETAIYRLATEYMVIYGVSYEEAKDKVVIIAKDKLESEPRAKKDGFDDFDDFDKDPSEEEDEDEEEEEEDDFNYNLDDEDFDDEDDDKPKKKRKK